MGDLTENFSRKEFACKCGCGFDTVDFKLLAILQALCEDIEQEAGAEVSMLITSGSRCEKHNKAEGGAPDSQHRYGRAADFKVFFRKSGQQIAPDWVYDKLDAMHPNALGLGRYDNRTHLDTRTKGPARWDKRSKK